MDRARLPWVLQDEKAHDGWRIYEGRRKVGTFEHLEDAQAAVAAVNIVRGLPSGEPFQ